MSNPFLTALQELVTGVSADPEPELSEPVDGDQLLHQIAGFIARYLQCSEHQRTVLALWVLHTYCFSAAQVAPYLSIQSAQKQSGKTLCLQLLNLLCAAPVFTTGFTASALTRRLNACVSTLLLDECQATLGTRSRSKAPTLRSILAGGFHRDLGYTVGFHERNLFCPKAFAGMGQLPEALADRSIPIILQPLKRNMSQFDKTLGIMKNCDPIGNAEKVFRSPDHPITSDQPMIQRFHLLRATEQAKPLRQQLRAWSKQNLPNLKEIEPYNEADFPPNLSSRRQDLCEPLLQLADTVGGQWPTRIREALAGVFEEQVAFDLQPNLQLLSDLYQCFFRYGFPESLSTAVLLDWMHTLPTRPWDIDGPLSARNLARLLVAFEIRPRLQRIKGQAKPVRGYEMEDFLKPWKWHLDLNGPWANQSPAAQPASKPDVTDKPQTEIANKDAVCNTSTDADALSMPAPEDFNIQPGTNEQPLTSKLPNCQLTQPFPARRGLPNSSGSSLFPVTCDLSPMEARSQQLEAVPSEITNKDKGCNTSTHAQAAVAQCGEPQMKNITGARPPSAASAPVEELTHSNPALIEKLAASSQELGAALTNLSRFAGV